MRNALWILTCLTLLAGPAAATDIEGVRVTFSPNGGAALWPNDLNLATDVLSGARLGFNSNPWFGIEGSLLMSPTHAKGDVGAFNRTFFASGNAIVRFTPHHWVTPYVTGGWGNAHFDPDGGSERNMQGFEAGAGFEFRLGGGIGRRVDLRIDARNVFLHDPDDAVLRDQVQNTVLVTAGLQFSLGGSPRDSDLDGVADREDRCPDTPRLAQVTEGGCPIDTDRDGVYDGLDRCDTTARGVVVDEFGCGIDTDGDLVLDGLDRCPESPAGALVDASGCPLDGDGDGVFDGLDQCPATVAGVLVDPATGCGRDSDDDGVFDGVDVCADTPGGTAVDERGCPIPQTQQEVELLDTGLIRLSTVQFASGKAQLRPESFEALRDVGTVLARWPQLRIEIGGHTDSQGGEDTNQRLSEQRAQAVHQWLMDNFPGEITTQYTVVGYGETRSIATNDTKDGRAQNRRVEFRVLNREVLSR